MASLDPNRLIYWFTWIQTVWFNIFLIILTDPFFLIKYQRLHILKQSILKYFLLSLNFKDVTDSRRKLLTNISEFDYEKQIILYN